ncbi:ACT domain-containing protein [Zobellia barbeyronii]|uniref:ACT domain-containing protein n=1 Tax=Zobellia barbeyronii TaxID=2748009 RepID=A0ABS5W9P6_9FLAO|nr:ACT domain-containing protein [Zobellia barbeyronii]MBT2159944.1 ACT domain-containing protein [Zobellia barbeyronii]
MAGEKNLAEMIKGMTPKLNEGEYVFITLTDANQISRADTLCEFKEQEGTTVIIAKQKADALRLPYEYVASWITLEIHSSLEGVGLTALFSSELAKNNISCNVVAAYYHDHIFVDHKDAQKAVTVLRQLSKNYSENG